MAPSIDASEINVPRSPSPTGRGRSVSPTDGTRVETIPEDGTVSQSQPKPQPRPQPGSPPRRQEPQVSMSPKKEEPVNNADNFRRQTAENRGIF